jgi:hypothetical protein
MIAVAIDAPLELAKERLLPHHPQHPLVVDRPALTLESLRHAPVAVAREL